MAEKYSTKALKWAKAKSSADLLNEIQTHDGARGSPWESECFFAAHDELERRRGVDSQIIQATLDVIRRGDFVFRLVADRLPLIEEADVKRVLRAWGL